MSSIIAIALKDLRALWRDRMALFWVLAFAPICATFFGTIFSGGGGGEPNRMKVAVIDGDHSDASQSFMDRLAASDALKVNPSVHEDNKPAATRHARPSAYPDRESSRAAVLKGDLVAYIMIKKGFGDSQGMFFGKAPPLEVD